MLKGKNNFFRKIMKMLIILMLTMNYITVFSDDISENTYSQETSDYMDGNLLNSCIIEVEDTIESSLREEKTDSNEIIVNSTSSTLITEETSEETISTDTVTSSKSSEILDPYFPLEPSAGDFIGDKVQPGQILAPLEQNGFNSRVSKINQEIIENVNKGVFKRAVVKQDWRTYSMFPYKSLDGGVQNRPHGIVIHETANPNSTIENEIAYMDRNWRSAFVHAFVDQNKIIEIHDPSYGAWGAGREANKYFMHVELVEHPNNRTSFMKSILNDAYYVATKLYQFGLSPSRPSKKKGDISGTIWSHHEVSSYLGGTDHSDPTGYFAKFGYSMEQFYELVQYEYSQLNREPPRINYAKLTDVNHIKETFTVEVDVTSDIGIKKVEIPVWTKADQSDIKWYTANLSSKDKYSIEVKTSDFDNSRGIYTIHCYVEDLTGMTSFTGVDNVFFKGIPPKITNPKVEKLDNSSGTFDILVEVYSDYGIKKVEVPVWTMADQSDIKWYTAELQSTGQYKVTIESKDFNFAASPYNIHIYATSKRDVVNMIGLNPVSFNFPNILGDIKIENIDSYYEKYKISLAIDNFKEVEEVEIPVWGISDGQNDLRWYRAKFNSDNNRWEVFVDISNHKEFGIYLAHAYVTLKSGKVQLIASSDFKIPNPKVTTKIIRDPKMSGKATVKINIDTKMKISNVLVPVWKDSDQGDLYWYTATHTGNNNYEVKIDYKNHKLHLGRYNIHIYSYMENGTTFIEGTPGVDLEKIELKPKVSFKSISEEEYLISLDINGSEEISKIEFPTWSQGLGQDDLYWYQGIYNKSTDRWEARIKLSNHKDTGLYLTHLYIKTLNGDIELFDTPGFVVDSVKSDINLEKNDVLGKQKLLIKLDNSKNISKVEVPVWSKSDQSDIVWYAAKKKGNNEYEVTVDYSLHQFNTGEFSAHLYITEKNGMRTINAIEQFILLRPELTPKVMFSNEDQKQEKYRIIIDTNDHPEVVSVKVPTWGEEDGQNDLQWYSATYSKQNSTWEYTVDIKKHKEVGQYLTHVYLYLQDGTYQIFDTTGFQVFPVKLSQEIDNTNAYKGVIKLTLNLDTKSKTTKIEVPIWSKNNQEDIKWYTAEEKDGKYEVLVDYKNHKNNTGIFNVHAYVYTTNGIVSLFGLPSIVLSNPVLTDNTTKGVYLREAIPIAQKIAKKNGLYSSVMIAQSVLESGYGTSRLSNEANNFFGMKFKSGEDNGKYEVFYIESKEYDYLNNQWIIIKSPFRKYINKKDSFEDNALKLVSGVSWDSNYYSGTWKKNTRSYKDATAALQGKYATDPGYADKLNDIIEKWHLDQYD